MVTDAEELTWSRAGYVQRFRFKWKSIERAAPHCFIWCRRVTWRLKRLLLCERAESEAKSLSWQIKLKTTFMIPVISEPTYTKKVWLCQTCFLIQLSGLSPLSHSSCCEATMLTFSSSQYKLQAIQVGNLLFPWWAEEDGSVPEVLHCFFFDGT